MTILLNGWLNKMEEKNMRRLTGVHYAKEEGKLVAYEKYNDNTTRKIQIKNGMVDYILNGSEDEVKG